MSDDDLGNVSLGEAPSSDDEQELQQDIDVSKIVANLKVEGKIGGVAFKRRYMSIKGGTYKQWAVDRTIKEGPRADYASKKFAQQHFGFVNKEARLKPGHIPHLPVNTVFYSRAEMEAIGFHGKQMNGIDYCSAKQSKYMLDDEPLPYALTVISSGGYEDDVESPDGEWLWYTGEGGNDLNSSRRQVAGQKMKGGNEALLNSHKLSLPVRLARFIGKFEEDSYTGIKYIYDGLYDVAQVKQEKGTQNYGVIKFLLVRQKNEANGKLRPNAVPPRHERILQLGARDGSTAKYEAAAKRQREEAAQLLSGKPAASGRQDKEAAPAPAPAPAPGPASPPSAQIQAGGAQSTQPVSPETVPPAKSKRNTAQPPPSKKRKGAAKADTSSAPNKFFVRGGVKKQECAADEEVPPVGARVRVTFKGMGHFDGEVLRTEVRTSLGWTGDNGPLKLWKVGHFVSIRVSPSAS
eukprot:COSAG01_NODE_7401_length_3221_cov_2.139334_1_plen_463_part_00